MMLTDIHHPPPRADSQTTPEGHRLKKGKRQHGTETEASIEGLLHENNIYIYVLLNGYLEKASSRE